MHFTYYKIPLYGIFLFALHVNGLHLKYIVTRISYFLKIQLQIILNRIELHA